GDDARTRNGRARRPSRMSRLAAAAAQGQTLASFGAGASLLTTFLNVAPTVTFGTFLALTLTVSPLWGFRAVVAARARCSKVRKPLSATFSPLATSAVTVSSKPLSTAAAVVLSVPAWA